MKPLLRQRMLADGAICDLVLSSPPGNILDAELMQQLQQTLAALPTDGPLRAILFRADGVHFSYGASVQEHRPQHIAASLTRLDALLSALAAAPAPTIACVQGVCLGGGFELVLACDLILASDDAEFACPEIELGAFAPAATALLGLRVAAQEANRILLTGARLSAPRAFELGMVQELYSAEELELAARRWVERQLLDKSAAALRQAVAAARLPLRRALQLDWPEHRRRYLEQLMPQADALEGVEAFLAKRPPNWRHA